MIQITKDYLAVKPHKDKFKDKPDHYIRDYFSLLAHYEMYGRRYKTMEERLDFPLVMAEYQKRSEARFKTK